MCKCTCVSVHVCVCVKERERERGDVRACARDMEKRVNIRQTRGMNLSLCDFFLLEVEGVVAPPPPSSSNFLPSFPFLEESCCWCYSWHFARFYQVRENGILSSLLHLHLRGPMLDLLRAVFAFWTTRSFTLRSYYYVWISYRAVALFWISRTARKERPPK